MADVTFTKNAQAPVENSDNHLKENVPTVNTTPRGAKVQPTAVTPSAPVRKGHN
jgi:hypothetical protein